MELLITVTSADGAQAPASPVCRYGHRRAAEGVAVRGGGDLGVDRAASAAPALISKDGKTGLIVAGITGGESEAQKHAKELTDRLGPRPRRRHRARGRRGDDLRRRSTVRAKKTCC